MLNSLELTGRSATHVRDVPALGCALHERAADAFAAMREEALAAGLDLKVVSGYRDFKRQVAIWSAKFKGERPLLDRSGCPIAPASLDESSLIDAILTWSALPGASRHHWGTDIDVIDAGAVPAGGRVLLTGAEFAPGGCFERLDRWLAANMARFGFFRPYSTDRGGVGPEAWHLSHAGTSVPALSALSIELLAEAIAETNMPGRDAVLARLPELYSRYVIAVDAP